MIEPFIPRRKEMGNETINKLLFEDKNLDFICRTVCTRYLDKLNLIWQFDFATFPAASKKYNQRRLM